MASIAFALAGLGGFNAHGAGFLAAATDCAVVPDLVTATSGQIVVLADWLQGKDLAKSLIDPTLARTPFAQLAVAFSGEPGVFEPAFRDAIMRWWTPPQRSEAPLEALLDRLFPAQVYVPTRSPADFEEIADTLNNGARIGERKIGVVFNAYNLETGQAALFGNGTAQDLWLRSKAIHLATRSSGRSNSDTGADEQSLLPITAEAVRSALWLSFYGFERLPMPHLIDGAYHRSCLVAELHQFDRIFAARPLAEGWLGRPPGNWFEVQDWQTEMWFSVGYKAEVDALHKINGLVAQGNLGAPYHIVDLIEVAPATPAGFFNYFIEREAIFRRAREQAIAAFGSQSP
jgi:hypothetical protein